MFACLFGRCFVLAGRLCGLVLFLKCLEVRVLMCVLFPFFPVCSLRCLVLGFSYGVVIVGFQRFFLAEVCEFSDVDYFRGGFFPACSLWCVYFSLRVGFCVLLGSVVGVSGFYPVKP